MPLLDWITLFYNWSKLRNSLTIRFDRIINIYDALYFLYNTVLLYMVLLQYKASRWYSLPLHHCTKPNNSFHLLSFTVLNYTNYAIPLQNTTRPHYSITVHHNTSLHHHFTRPFFTRLFHHNLHSTVLFYCNEK